MAKSRGLEKYGWRERFLGLVRRVAVQRFVREGPCLLGIFPPWRTGREYLVRCDWRSETNRNPTFSRLWITRPAVRPFYIRRPMCGSTSGPEAGAQCGSSARSLGSNGMDRPASFGASVEEQHIICIARRHLWQPHDCCAARPLAVEPSPSAHRCAAARLTAQGAAARRVFPCCEWRQRHLRTQEAFGGLS